MYMYSTCKQDCLTWAWYVLCLNNTSHCHKWVRCIVIHAFCTDLYMHTLEINSYTRHFSSLVLETLSVRLPPTFSGFPVSRWGLTLSQLHCQELDLVCCPTAEHCWQTKTASNKILFFTHLLETMMKLIKFQKNLTDWSDHLTSNSESVWSPFSVLTDLALDWADWELWGMEREVEGGSETVSSFSLLLTFLFLSGFFLPRFVL